MGGDLEAIAAGRAPTFLVAAAKDPLGANLDRIQIIKGWLDRSGELRERIYDVAYSAGRERDSETGRLQPVGNTVDVGQATFRNSIGEALLSAQWRDPDFDPGLRAFYYARVIEIPTPRWPAYDARAFGFELPPDVTAINRDRAYSSPIWYTPQRPKG